MSKISVSIEVTASGNETQHLETTGGQLFIDKGTLIILVVSFSRIDMTFLLLFVVLRILFPTILTSPSPVAKQPPNESDSFTEVKPLRLTSHPLRLIPFIESILIDESYKGTDTGNFWQEIFIPAGVILSCEFPTAREILFCDEISIASVLERVTLPESLDKITSLSKFKDAP